MPKPISAAKKSKKVGSSAVEMPPAAPLVEEETNESIYDRDPDVVREVIYPTLETEEYSTVSEHGPVTPDDMRSLLYWQTEEQYIAQMMKEKPGSKRDDWLFLDDFHCFNTDKKKVRCWNNANNRPFDMVWCEKLMKTILWGLWSGPHTIPGETVNGETIRISKYGMVLSGQHQGTALILADEWLRKSRDKDYTMYYDPDDTETEKYKFWIGQPYPFIETLVVTGLSEDERVIRSIDYVKTRTVADMLYTMPLFKRVPNERYGKEGHPKFRKSTPQERNEMTRLLEKATDLLWTRTEAQGYRTHPEIVGFLERHTKLLKCVEHLFLLNRPVTVNSKRNEGESKEQHEARVQREEQDGGRRISKLRLSPGHCAALMYLMGTSATDDDTADDYRGSSPPTEKMLDLSMWHKAQYFWMRFAGSAEDRTFLPVRIALNRLVEVDEDGSFQGLGGRFTEKVAIIAKAWDVFKDLEGAELTDPFPSELDEEGHKFYPDLIAPDGALSLSYSSKDEKGNSLPEGQVRLVNIADFKGIDVPENLKSAKADDPPPPPKVMDKVIETEVKKIEEERVAKIAKQDERKDARKVKPEDGPLDKVAARAAANSAAAKANKLKGGTEK